MIYDDENNKNVVEEQSKAYKYILAPLGIDGNEIIFQNEKVINSKIFFEDALETMNDISTNKNKNDKYTELVNNAPIFLFRKKTKKLISYLLNLGLNEDEIIKLLCTSFNKCVDLSEKAADTLPINNEYYYNFVTKSEDAIKKGDVSPESYKFRIKRIMNEHEDLLRRLK